MAKDETESANSRRGETGTSVPAKERSKGREWRGGGEEEGPGGVEGAALREEVD